MTALRVIDGRLSREEGAEPSFIVIKPPYLFPFVVVLLARRRWTALAGCGTTLLLLFAVPALLLGPSLDSSFLHTLVQAAGWRHNQVGGFDAAINRGYAGFVQLLLPASFQTLVTATLDVVTVSVVALFTLRSPRLDQPFALGVIAPQLRCEVAAATRGQGRPRYSAHSEGFTDQRSGLTPHSSLLIAHSSRLSTQEDI